MIAKVSRGLGEAMVGINVDDDPRAAPARRARLVTRPASSGTGGTDGRSPTGPEPRSARLRPRPGARRAARRRRACSREVTAAVDGRAARRRPGGGRPREPGARGAARSLLDEQAAWDRSRPTTTGCRRAFDELAGARRGRAAGGRGPLDGRRPSCAGAPPRAARRRAWPGSPLRTSGTRSTTACSSSTCGTATPPTSRPATRCSTWSSTPLAGTAWPPTSTRAGSRSPRSLAPARLAPAAQPPHR